MIALQAPTVSQRTNPVIGIETSDHFVRYRLQRLRSRLRITDAPHIARHIDFWGGAAMNEKPDVGLLKQSPERWTAPETNTICGFSVEDLDRSTPSVVRLLIGKIEASRRLRVRG